MAVLYENFDRDITLDVTAQGSAAEVPTAGTGGGTILSGEGIESFGTVKESGTVNPSITPTGALDGSGGETQPGGTNILVTQMDTEEKRGFALPPAAALTGSGSAIELIIDGIIDRTDYSDEHADDLEDSIYFEDVIGVPLVYEFEWQTIDSDVEWPVTLTSTFAVSIDDPSIIESLDIAALGEDCDVDVEIVGTSVDSSTGLMFVDLEFTYECPTDIQVPVYLDPGDNDTSGENPGGMTPPDQDPGDGPPPSNNDGDGGPNGGGGPTGGGSHWSRTPSRNAGLSGLGCLPTGESTDAQIRVTSESHALKSLEATFSFDPELVQIERFHSDDTIFAERNEHTDDDYRHRMTVDGSTIDNVAGTATVQASTTGSISHSRWSEAHQKIMVSVEATAVGASGETPTITWESGTFLDPDGNDVPRLSGSGTQFRINNGIFVDDTTLTVDEIDRTPLEARIGEGFDEFRSVVRFNPEVVAEYDVIGPAGTTLSVVETTDDETSVVYAVVEGSLDAVQRMTTMFSFEWSAHSSDDLLEAIESDEPIPSSTSLTVLDREDVALLNTAVVEGETELDHVPVAELPLPYIRESGGESVEWACSSDGSLKHQTIATEGEPITQCPDDTTVDEERGWCIPEVGVVYWPLVFNLIVEIPGVYPDAIQQSDIRVETTSTTNPGITHHVDDLIRGDSTVYVPLTILIPKADPQDYPVDFDFEMWIGGSRVDLGGGGGLHIGGGIESADHGPRIFGGKVAHRLGIGGGPF